MKQISKGHHARGKIWPPTIFPADIFLICSGSNVAVEIAEQVISGNIASIYQSARQCVDAYRAYPPAHAMRYRPYVVRMDRDGTCLFVGGIE